MYRWLHRYSIFVIAMTVALIWWGAAVTTEKVGMAVPDWPLSYGSINPEGWWKVWPILLEHGHRTIAAAVGLLTLGMFAWAYVRSWRKALELTAVVAALASIVVLLGIGAEWRRAGSEYARYMFMMGGGIGMIVLGWLGYRLTRKEDSLVVKLTALALILVSTQAILGGLRVTEISNTYAVIHGCLAQVFFCLLIMIAIVTSSRWESRPL